MQILIWVLAVIAVYFFIVFFLLRLAVPFMGFGGRLVLPGRLPNDIKLAITNLERKSSGPGEYLQHAYDLILQKSLQQWGHTRFKAGTHLHRLFARDPEEMWHTEKFLYCQGINYLSFLLLAGSRFFAPDDIRARAVFLNFVPHQYLQVRLQGKWEDFDPAGAGIRGGRLGRHAEWFG